MLSNFWVNVFYKNLMSKFVPWDIIYFAKWKRMCKDKIQFLPETMVVMKFNGDLIGVPFKSIAVLSN